MALILSIETSTKNCSVALARNGELISIREDDTDKYNHAEKLHVFIEQTMREAGISFDQLQAIAVSEGPGSYTGLRIGVSAAKGLAFAKNIPMIAVNTLESMAFAKKDGNKSHLYIPMIDARRMEVFCAGFDGTSAQVFPTRAEVLEAGSFPEAHDFEKVFYLGDGAEKCIPVLSPRPEFEFLEGIHASAQKMIGLAEEAFKTGRFVDLPYFEPFYLKDFVAGKKKG